MGSLPAPRREIDRVYRLPRPGFGGFEFARRRDRGVAYLLGTLWLVTGLGLVIYMNFKAGFSRFWDMYASWDQHEVRERDYSLS